MILTVLQTLTVRDRKLLQNVPPLPSTKVKQCRGSGGHNFWEVINNKAKAIILFGLFLSFFCFLEHSLVILTFLVMA